MIQLELTVREAMNLATSWAFNNDIVLYHKIVNAFEKTLTIDTNTNPNCTVTITNGMTVDNRTRCIKHIRNYTGWDLRTTKKWTDTITGFWNETEWAYPTHHTNSITLKHPNDAENLLRELTSLGCEGYLS